MVSALQLIVSWATLSARLIQVDVALGSIQCNDSEIAARLSDYHRQIADLREKMRALQASVEPVEVQDYAFATPEGSVQLSALFGGRDVIVIHNMGSSCAYCTRWADGFNGIYDHIASRAAFVVSSPDRPDVQQKFAPGRNWGFTMASHAETTFAADIG